MSSGAAFDPSDPDFQYLAVDRKKLAREQTQPFDGKKMCWVPDEKEGFVGAEIQSSKGEEITVKTIEKQEVGVAMGRGNGHPFFPSILFALQYTLPLF
jgi:hypothetical protein